MRWLESDFKSRAGWSSVDHHGIFVCRWCVFGCHPCSGQGRSVRTASVCFSPTRPCTAWTLPYRSLAFPAGTSRSPATAESPSPVFPSTGPPTWPTWWHASCWNPSVHFGVTQRIQRNRLSSVWRQTCRSLERGSQSWQRLGRSCTSCWPSRTAPRQQTSAAPLSSYQENEQKPSASRLLLTNIKAIKCFLLFLMFSFKLLNRSTWFCKCDFCFLTTTIEIKNFY